MKSHSLKPVAWSLRAGALALLLLVCLPGCDSNPAKKHEGIRVGNGLKPGEELYESRFAFSFYYDNSLELSVSENEKHIVVKAPGDLGSSVSFDVDQLPRENHIHSNLESLKELAKKKVGSAGHVEGPLDHGGTRGYFSQVDEQSFIYFLLLPNGRYLQMTSSVSSVSPTASKLLTIPSRVMIDFTPPQVTSLLWEVPFDAVLAGTEVAIVAAANDEGAGVDTDRTACIMVRPVVRNYAGQGISFCTKWKEIGDELYEYRFKLDQFIAHGEYELESIEVFDRAGNRTIPTISPGRLTVLNQGLEDIEPPVINSVFVRGIDVLAGGESQLVLALQDSGSGIAPYISSCATFARRGSENHFGIEVCGSLHSEDENHFSLPIQVSPYVPAGDYYLTSVSARDIAGNYRTMVLTEAGFLEDYTGTKKKNSRLSTPILTVVSNLAADTMGPKLSEIKLPQSKARGTLLEVTFKVSDDNSGFDFTAPVNVVLQPTDPRLRHLKISMGASAFCLDSENWLIEIPIPRFANPGTYKLLKLQAFDFAGNASEELVEHAEVFIAP